MKKTLISAAILAVASVSSAFAGSHSDKVVVEFGYPYPHLFDVTYEAMMPSFKEKHPNIEMRIAHGLGILRDHEGSRLGVQIGSRLNTSKVQFGVQIACP